MNIKVIKIVMKMKIKKIDENLLPLKNELLELEDSIRDE
jgi:hypothetical protein